jgi:hypothetical protein
MLFFKRQPFPSADVWAYKEGVGAYPLVAFGGDPDKNVDGFGGVGRVAGQLASGRQPVRGGATRRDGVALLGNGRGAGPDAAAIVSVDLSSDVGNGRRLRLRGARRY